MTRTELDGTVATLIDRHEGNRLNRPNDVICRSDGTVFFTDPALRVPVAERDVGEGAVYRLSPDGSSHLVAWCEYPNGLALSPDERTLYVANTRWTAYIHAIELDATGNMVRRRVFADMSSDLKQRRARRHESGRGGPRLLHGPWWCVDLLARWDQDRCHRDPGGHGQSCLRRPRSQDAISDVQYVDLYTASDDARKATSVVQTSTARSS